MKERLDELSGGSVELDIYPSGVIGSEPQCIEQLQNGVLAMTKTSSAALEGFTPDMGVFGLPYASATAITSGKFSMVIWGKRCSCRATRKTFVVFAILMPAAAIFTQLKTNQNPGRS